MDNLIIIIWLIYTLFVLRWSDIYSLFIAFEYKSKFVVNGLLFVYEVILVKYINSFKRNKTGIYRWWEIISWSEYVYEVEICQRVYSKTH